MIVFIPNFARLAADRRGVTALEYGLIAALIASVIVAGVTLVGSGLNNEFTAVAALV